MDDRFSGREQGILDNTHKACDIVKAKVGLELELYKQSNSVTENSIDFITNSNDSGQSHEVFQNNKTLARTMTPPGGHVPVSNASANGSASNSNYSNYNSFNASYVDSSYTNPYTNGSVSTLILVGVLALIILVVVVSLFIMNYIGL